MLIMVNVWRIRKKDDMMLCSFYECMCTMATQALATKMLSDGIRMVESTNTMTDVSLTCFFFFSLSLSLSLRVT